MKAENPALTALRKLKRHTKHKPSGKAHIFIGKNFSSSIDNVSKYEINYTDQLGKSHTILIIECTSHNDHRNGYIGARGILSSPPWIEFFDSNSTRFEFESKEQARKFLSTTLAPLGLKTADLD